MQICLQSFLKKKNPFLQVVQLSEETQDEHELGHISHFPFSSNVDSGQLSGTKEAKSWILQATWPAKHYKHILSLSKVKPFSHSWHMVVELQIKQWDEQGEHFFWLLR